MLQIKKYLIMKKCEYLLIAFFLFTLSTFLQAQDITTFQHGEHIFKLPKEFLEERKDVPPFWLATNEEVDVFLSKYVKKGHVEKIGISSGGRPIKAVSYGTPRKGEGTSTFSGSLGFRDVGAYRGPDHNKKVCLIISGVHGGEFEAIVGTINLISIIETGKDLRGKEWPEIMQLTQKIDRLVLIPIANPDGRARVPIRMQKFRGTDLTVHEFLNTGGYPDGSLIGWPQVKEFIPMDFERYGFAGGYPNDAGVNIQHDDFFGEIQPETKALFYITKREKPDITLNMHTGSDYMMLLRPNNELRLQPVFDSLYTRVHSRLAKEGLLKSDDIEKEADPSKLKHPGGFNLNAALNAHCGTLCLTVESPSHGYDRFNDYSSSTHTPDLLLDAHLYCYKETIRFLLQSGGRAEW